MPKQGEKYNWYNENPQRVTFKDGRFGKKGSQKDLGNPIPAHQEEVIIIDVDAGSINDYNNGTKKDDSKKGDQPGSSVPHKGGKPQKLLKRIPNNWYRVYLPYGNKYDKDYILCTLLAHVAPIPFTPICWSTRGTTATFYVDEYELAKKLVSLNRQVRFPDGYTMLIRVVGGTPDVNMNPTMKEKIKLTIAKHYNKANKVLDLTKFYADPDLHDLFCALLKPIVFVTVVEIISENIPEVEALILHDNKIEILGYYLKLGERLPHLKILHLGNNTIRDITMLDGITGLPIVDLVLEGNPLCSKFKERSAYISAVRKRFPKIIKLDGIDLLPSIGFDIGEEVTLPPTQQIFLCNDEAHGIVCQVLEQYFEIFDSESRQALLQVYHENVMFSMTSAYPYGHNPINSSSLDWYKKDSRNLLRIKKSNQWMKLLHQGQLPVVAFLSAMPATKHDIHSFTVDLNLFTPQMLLLTVTGIFKELQSGHESEPMRFFCRTLVIVPVGSGFCIANEQLHVTNATEEQAKHAFKTPVFEPEAAPAVAALSPVAVSCAPVRVAIPTMPDENTKQQMIQAMSQESGMNLEWSQKCLESTNWDFDRAEFEFIKLQKQGAIPGAAFV